MADDQRDQLNEVPAVINKALRHDLFESLLLEGLDSGDPVPLDESELASIREEVHQRLHKLTKK